MLDSLTLTYYRKARREAANWGRDYSKRYPLGLYPERYGRHAQHALKMARDAAALNGKPGYVPGSIWAGRKGSDGRVFSAYGEKQLRWIEKPESKGLRFIGLAHDVAPRLVEHKGWYTDEFQNETVSGVVYQLTGKDGVSRYLSGYADPYNCDKNGRGPALLSLEIFADTDSDEAKRDAAGNADHIAKRFAEEERAYQESNRLGREAREKATEALTEGKEMVAQCRALRRFWKVRNGTPALPAHLARQAIREALQSLRYARESYQEARDKFLEALETGHGWRCGSCEAWREGYAEGN